jgi:hypothetical protein
VVLTPDGERLLRIELTDRDAARVKVDQSISVQAPGPGRPALDGAIVDIVKSRDGYVSGALARVAWGDSPPDYGTGLDASVTLQKKDDVLVVPKRAIRSAGARQYVEYLAGTSRKIANVEVGISSDTEAEVRSGVTEGQVVLVSP